MTTYKLGAPQAPDFHPANCVIRTDDNGSQHAIPFDPANTDYQAYLKWVSEGNTPEPAENT